MHWTFTGAVIEWRGPAPFVFVEIDRDTSIEIKAAAAGFEYWGQVAVSAVVNEVDFETALFPKDGRYLLPVKVAVQRAADVGVGDVVDVALSLRISRTGQ